MLDFEREALGSGLQVDSEEFAKYLDGNDELRKYRETVCFPSEDAIYLCGNSLGLQPKGIRSAILQDLDRWAVYGVEGHFVEEAPSVPWWTIEDLPKADLTNIVGAHESEIAVMNSLTVNLHLLLAAFYKPTKSRFKIIIEANAFPSDEYVVQSVATRHNFDPNETIVRISANTNQEMATAIRQIGEKNQVALILIAPLQYLTGIFYDIQSIVYAGHHIGAIVGLDLAHAVGNVELSLHDHQVDFACWCSYKYLNAGPGAIAGAFVHQKHQEALATNTSALRGWWGNKRDSRFLMQQHFDPQPGIAGLQLSNPPTLPVIQLAQATALINRASMPKLRAKSKRLTAYLEFLLRRHLKSDFNMLTPSDPERRGAQLSLYFPHRDVDTIFAALRKRSVFVDVRRPDVIRVAPAPLYNSFTDVHRFVTVLVLALHEVAVQEV
uniref:Kynureninase n=1 Tax=Aureoumbra lagunensis TaxID=44058 RepID=A0A7S3K4P8_9STRA|mmetsp:Transcript_3221/g.4464  ORF Transcript_3221/g.4464 Transcript_3221/m.4464 type:complete len:438 (-) Transcript_3221:52-1365(-)